MTPPRPRCDPRPQGGTAPHEEARPIATTHPADGHPWCVEHDPSGACLGGIHELPGGGAAWLEGAAEPVLVVALTRSGERRPPRFAAAEARSLAAALTALADQLDRSGAAT